MVTYAGKNVYCLFGVESTFNSAAASITKDIGIIENVNPDFNNNNIAVHQIGSRESAENIAGNFDVSIGIDGTLNSGAIFELMFGQSTDTQTTGDYKHTFINASGSETLPLTASSFSMSENFNSSSDIQNTYTGCKVNSLEVSIETGDVLKFSADIIGTSVSKDTSVGTQVTTNTTKFGAYYATIDTGTLSSEAEVGQTKSVSITFNQNIDANAVKAIGSRFNQDLVEQNFDVNVTFTKTFANTTEFERFLGGTTPSTSTPTPTALIFQVTNGVTLGSGRLELYIKVVGGQYESTSHTVSQDGVVEETFNYVGGSIQDVFFVDAVSTYF